MNKNQTKRAALFVQQDNKCALCGDPCTTPNGMIYAPEQNALICRSCSTWKANYLHACKRGITIAQLNAFLIRDPAPEPDQPASTTVPASTVQLKPTQMEGLRAVLEDRSQLTLAEWCGRAGITEEDAVQYAHQHGSTCN